MAVKKGKASAKKKDSSSDKGKDKGSSKKKPKTKAQSGRLAVPKKDPKKKQAKSKKAQKSKARYVRICPECGSIDIAKDSDLPLNPTLPTIYRCNACRHTSHVFPEIEEQRVEFFRKRINDDLRILSSEADKDLSIGYGRFQANLMWKVSGIFLFLVGLIMLMSTQENDIPLIFPILILMVSLFMIYTIYLVRH